MGHSQGNCFMSPFRRLEFEGGS